LINKLRRDSSELVWYLKLYTQNGEVSTYGQQGNEKHDLEQAERQAKEKARLHIRQEKFTPETKEQREGNPIETTLFDVRQSSGRSGSYSEDFSPRSTSDGGSLSKKRKASALKSSEAEASNLGKLKQKKVEELEIKKAKR
jgi:hypothetical protein